MSALRVRFQSAPVGGRFVITPEIVAGIPLLARLPAADRTLIASRAADVHLHAGEWLSFAHWFTGAPGGYWM